jgi:dTDP-4-dehydrorhamnose reductase
VESDPAAPLNAYGRAKLEAERLVLEHAPGSLLIRTAAFFGPWDGYNFVAQALDRLRQNERWPAARDQFVSPTYVPDLVQAALDLLVDGSSGVWHLSNRGAVSWAGLAHLAAEAAGLDRRLIDSLPTASLRQVARRPRYSALASERALLMPTLEDAIPRFLKDRETWAGEWPEKTQHAAPRQAAA